jgi:hypothetical protein
MTDLVASGYWNNTNRTIGEQKANSVELLRDFLSELHAAGAEQALTLATGVITPATKTSRQISVDTQAAAATDNLITITTTNVPTGGHILLRTVSSARVVTVKHLGGNVNLIDAADRVLSDPSQFILLRRNGANFDEVPPAKHRRKIQTKTTNYTAVWNDQHTILRFTTTALTLSLTAAASLGNGWSIIVECAASVLLIIDPNAAETINGVTTIKMAGGGAVLITCDGTNFRAIRLRQSKERQAVTAAATTDLSEDTIGSQYSQITGATAMTAITVPVGEEADVEFAGASNITSGASLILRGANIVTAAGECAKFIGEASSVTRLTDYNSGTLRAVAASTAQAQAGTSSELVMTPANLFAALGFSNYYQSAQQTITNGSTITLTHGLGRRPILYQAVLQCVTTDLNYTAGDEITQPWNSTPSSNGGVDLVLDNGNTTQIKLLVGSGGINIHNKTTWANATITNANWKLVVRAWG